MKKTDSKANREAYAKLSSLYKEWIQQCRSIVGANTIASYKASLKLFFLEYLAKVKHIVSETFTLEDALSRDQITGWEKWLANERGNKPQSINIRRSNLIAFLEYISTKDLMYVQYYTAAKNIHCLKAIPVKTHSLTDQALELIINMPDVHTKAGLRDTVLMGLLYATAGRLNEALSIHIEDLCLSKNGEGESYVTLLGKGNKYRSMPLDKSIVEQLRLYISRIHGPSPNPKDYLFFSSYKGIKAKLSERAISKRLKAYAAEAHKLNPDVPLDFHSHQFRHTRATNWIKEGHQLPVVSKLLGHENIETTMHYLDITMEMMADAARQLKSPEAKNIRQEWTDEDVEQLFNF